MDVCVFFATSNKHLNVKFHSQAEKSRYCQKNLDFANICRKMTAYLAKKLVSRNLATMKISNSETIGIHK